VSLTIRFIYLATDSVINYPFYLFSYWQYNDQAATYILLLKDLLPSHYTFLATDSVITETSYCHKAAHAV